jgi:hypothetical protein
MNTKRPEKRRDGKIRQKGRKIDKERQKDRITVRNQRLKRRINVKRD